MPPRIGRCPWRGALLLAFAGIGAVAGLFSALFGVGGGIVIVPLLVILCGIAPKPATGTSLAAIGLTALFGAIAYGILGDVHWGEAATVGLPAVAGVPRAWVQETLVSSSSSSLPSSS